MWAKSPRDKPNILDLVVSGMLDKLNITGAIVSEHFARGFMRTIRFCWLRSLWHL